LALGLEGEELIEWMINKLDIKDAEEALHLATFLCKYGYYFHATTNNSTAVKEDGELFRFQVSLPVESSAAFGYRSYRLMLAIWNQGAVFLGLDQLERREHGLR
jgi:hypothetical protein